MRLWLKVLFVLLFVWGFVIPIVLFIVTNRNDLDRNILLEGGGVELHSEGKGNERKPLDYNPELDVGQEQMQYRVKELEQIALSVRNELRSLEQERTRVHKELQIQLSSLTKVQKDLATTKTELQSSKGKLARTLREMKRAGQQSIVEPVKSSIVVINAPLSRENLQVPAISNEEKHKEERPRESLHLACSSKNCFDHSLCPLTRPFGVYLYNKHHLGLFDLKHPHLVDLLVASLRETDSFVNEQDKACVFIVLAGPLKESISAETLQGKLESLPHWGDGSNHIVIDLAYSNESYSHYLEALNFGRAIHARSYLFGNVWKTSNDLLLPPITNQVRIVLTPFLPALRQIFIYFEGNLAEKVGKRSESRVATNPEWLRQQLDSLKEAISANTQDKVAITTSCNKLHEQGTRVTSSLGEWELCQSPQQRADSIAKSTFSLVLNGRHGNIGPLTYLRLMEAIYYGAIPVLIGVENLPLDDVIDWKAAAVSLPATSLGQLHYILRNIDTDMILKYRRQGRYLWETYFSSSSRILDSIVAVARWWSLHPPPAAKDYVSVTTPFSVIGEIQPLPPTKFIYNFTTYTWEFWNTPPGPFHMYPVTPHKPVPISGSQYVGLRQEQVSNLPHHIITGGGITGPYFEDFLLGNVPVEQFTILILTYERNQVLLEALARLKDLDHLAKVVVVWNSPTPPPSGMQWPDIGVSIDVSGGLLVVKCKGLKI